MARATPASGGAHRRGRRVAWSLRVRRSRLAERVRRHRALGSCLGRSRRGLSAVGLRLRDTRERRRHGRRGLDPLRDRRRGPRPLRLRRPRAGSRLHSHRLAASGRARRRVRAACAGAGLAVPRTDLDAVVDPAAAAEGGSIHARGGRSGNGRTCPRARSPSRPRALSSGDRRRACHPG